MKLNINEWLIKDVAFTLKNFKTKIDEWEHASISERMKNEDKNPYLLAANAALITANHGFGDCFSIDDFIKMVEEGYLIDYDGIGRWVDFQGNELGKIHCDANWLKDNIPEEAKFVMWFNK